MANLVQIQLEIEKQGDGLKDVKKEINQLKKEMGGVDKAAKKNEENLESFGKTATKAVGSIAASVGVAVSTLALFVNSVVASNRELRQLATLSGLNFEEFQKFAFAATLAGSNADQAADAINNLSLKINEAAILGSGAVIDVFKNLGLSFDEIRKQSPDKQFESVARALSKVDKQQRKLFLDEIASDAFIQLSPLIDRYDELTQKAEDFQKAGGFISDEDNQKLIELDKSLKTFTTQISTTASTATAAISDELGGALIAATQKIQELVGASDGFIDLRVEVNRVVNVFKTFVGIVEVLKNGFKVSAELIAQLVDFGISSFDNLFKLLEINVKNIPNNFRENLTKARLMFSEFKDYAVNTFTDISGSFSFDTAILKARQSLAEFFNFVIKSTPDFLVSDEAKQLNLQFIKENVDLTKEQEKQLKIKEESFKKSEETLRLEKELNQLQADSLDTYIEQEKILEKQSKLKVFDLDNENLKKTVNDVATSFKELSVALGSAINADEAFILKSINSITRELDNIDIKAFTNQEEADKYFANVQEKTNNLIKYLNNLDFQGREIYIERLQKQLNAVNIQVVKATKEVSKSIAENLTSEVSKSAFNLGEELKKILNLENEQLIIKAKFQAGVIDEAQYKQQITKNVEKQQEIYENILKAKNAGTVSLSNQQETELTVKNLGLTKQLNDLEKQKVETKKESINYDKEILDLTLERLSLQGREEEVNRKNLEARIDEINASKGLSSVEKENLINAEKRNAEIVNGKLEIEKLIETYQRLSETIDQTSLFNNNDETLSQLQAIIDKVGELEQKYGLIGDASDDLKDKQKDNNKDAIKSYEDFSKKLTDTTLSFVDGSIKSFDDLKQAFIQLLLDMVRASLESQLTEVFTGLFTGGSTGSGDSSGGLLGAIGGLFTGSSTGGSTGGTDWGGIISAGISAISSFSGGDSTAGVSSFSTAAVNRATDSQAAQVQEKQATSSAQPINITNVVDPESISNALESSPSGERFVLNAIANNPDQVSSYISK